MEVDFTSPALRGTRRAGRGPAADLTPKGKAAVASSRFSLRHSATPIELYALFPSGKWAHKVSEFNRGYFTAYLLEPET